MENGRYLLVAMRDGEEVARSEYLDFLESSGLAESDLVHFPITSLTVDLPDLSQFDGVFVGGSPFNVTDWEHSDLQKHSHDLLFEILNSPVPALLTCYGTSYTAFTMGGQVNREFSEEAGTTEVQLTAEAASDPIASTLPDTFFALTGHKECVVQLPDEAVLLATGPSCPHQMYRIHYRNWVTQFHPEMNADGLLRRMNFYADKGYFDPAELDSIESEIRSVDLTAAGQVITGFMNYCSFVKSKNS